MIMIIFITNTIKSEYQTKYTSKAIQDTSVLCKRDNAYIRTSCFTCLNSPNNQVILGPQVA